MARAADPSETTSVLRGSVTLILLQGIKVFGTLLGHPAVVRAHFDNQS